MLGINFIKFPPTTHVFHFRGGELKRQGSGLSFFYFGPTSTIVAVPLASKDLPFAFVETTADFQTVTLQGQVTYRIADPGRISSLLDFSVDPDGRHRSEDPEQLEQRVVQVVQVLAQSRVQRWTLREALVSAPQMVSFVTDGLRASETVNSLGVEILGFSILSIRPTPEMSKALEAEAREDLQKNADEAIYKRRNAAVEQERLIKQNELETEIAVEEKQREIREKKMAAEIAVEERRAVFMDQRVKTDRLEAESKAFALDAMIKPLTGVDWRVLMMARGQLGAEDIVAMAFRDLADNAQKIGELNIGPEVMSTLMGRRKG